MSARKQDPASFDVATISDAEAAEKLGFPLRTIRGVIDANGLCLKAGRRRRLTPAHFEALIAVLTPAPHPNLSVSSSRRPQRVVPYHDTLAEALALAKLSPRGKSKQMHRDRSN